MPTWLPRPFKSTEHQPMFVNSTGSGVCYFSNAVYYPNWRIYSQQPPSILSLDFISHVFYAFAWPNQDGTVSLSDDYADTKVNVDGANGCIDALTRLKLEKPPLKVILSIGGSQGSTHFAGIASDPETRDTFARSLFDLVCHHGFDGIDIDWEHPSSPEQGADYIELLIAIRNYLPSPIYTLTSALPAGEWALKNIDIATASTYLDFINLMTYDFAGPWGDTSGHQSQLYTPERPHNHASATSCHSAVTYVLSKGVPPSKILLGVPVYGRSFLNADDVGQRYAGSAGVEGTFDYRDLPRPGTQEQVDVSIGAAFCAGGDGGFVTYDNPQTVQMKAKYVKEARLGGLFYWAGTGDAKGPRSLVENGYNALHDQ